MKKILFIFGLAFLTVLFLQNCKKGSNPSPSSGSKDIQYHKPLIDFGDSTYRGFTGGLYDNGSNARPATHNSAGLTLAYSIVPLNSAGNADQSNGKIVWMSIGMSHTTMQTQAFFLLTDTFANLNRRLTLIDGAEGGQAIDDINDANAPYWAYVNSTLSAKNISPAQVQVIWFKEAEKNPTDTSFITYPDALKVRFNSVMHLLKSKFSNLKMVYLSDRMYAGYATSTLNPEPYAWYSGWTIKKLIADQINGDASLKYSGANASVAWLAWGPYCWANGAMPRSDGLTYVPADYVTSDFTHPSYQGRLKVARLMLQFFSTDPTCTPWFLK